MGKGNKCPECESLLSLREKEVLVLQYSILAQEEHVSTTPSYSPLHFTLYLIMTFSSLPFRLLPNLQKLNQPPQENHLSSTSSQHPPKNNKQQVLMRCLHNKPLGISSFLLILPSSLYSSSYTSSCSSCLLLYIYYLDRYEYCCWRARAAQCTCRPQPQWPGCRAWWPRASTYLSSTRDSFFKVSL